MTTESTEPQQYDFSQDPDGMTAKDVSGEDFLFDVLLGMVVGAEDDSERNMSLTVTIGGHLVSGIVISSKEWQKRTVASLATASDSFSESFDEIATAVFEKKVNGIRKREAAELPSRALKYIHMRDAYIISGGTPQRLPLWRGNLTKLTGWSLGSINSPEEAAGQ